MIIDTTINANNFEKNFRKIYFKNYINQRKEYSSWIDSIGDKKNLDWWISLPASRNYNYSKLFHIFCLVESVKELILKFNISKLIVEDVRIKNIFQKQFKVNLVVQVKKKSIFAENNYILLLKNFIFFFIVFIFSKLGRRKKIDNDLNLTLIDTFLANSDLNQNRYYSNKLLKIISKKKNIFFIPSFYLGMGLANTIKIILNCKKNKNFLLKENYLKFKDLIFTLFLVLRRKKFKRTYDKLKKIDYSDIIYNEINSNINLSSQILAWQNYFFFKNIKKINIKVKKIINWFENQSQDKGWNLGARTFFPKAKSFGYQGFCHFPQYMCLSPTKSEFDSKVIPKVILSIGKMFNKPKKEFYKNLEIKTSPALNFQYLYKIKKKNINNNNVLVILSGFLNDDINLLRWVIKSGIQNKNYKVIIKEHPILKISKIKKNFNYFPEKFVISNKDFWESVYNSKNLICTGSTSAITELLVSGRACIIPRINPLDGKIFESLNIKFNHVILDDPLELIDYIKGNKIKKFDYKIENYFTKLTNRNINLFL